MAPSTKNLQNALIQGTCTLFAESSETISVNKVRKHVEVSLGLGEGFFVSGEWKRTSKDIIRDYVTKLHDGWQPESEGFSRGTKREPANSATPEAKRRKQVVQEESNLVKTEEPGKKLASRAKASEGVIEKENGEGEGGKAKGLARSTPSADKKRKRPIDGQSAEEDVGDDDQKAFQSSQNNGHGHATEKRKEPNGESKVSWPDENTELSLKPAAETDATQNETPSDQDGELSDIIYELPKPPRKKGVKGELGGKKLSVKGSASAPDDSKEAEIKKLQSHLVKCGVRKVWHNELKKYGDDARAKIRHLREMLADVGMDGRFSESKAREIKEKRELMADVAAAREMNELWGAETGGRASRSKTRRSMKEKHSDDSEQEEGGENGKGVKHGDEHGNDDEGDGDGEDDDGEKEEEEDGDENKGPKSAARRRARQDLAFLGDSDSDSD